MSTKFYDVLVAKEFEVTEKGKTETKTKWNRVGSAWPAKSGSSLLFELFLIPGHRYVINLKANDSESNANAEESNEEAPF